MLGAFWRALGGAADRSAALEVRRAGPVLASPLDVENLLVAAAGCTLLAAAELAEARTGRAPAVALDVDRLAIAASSERWLRRDGAVVGAPFDPLSAFMPAADGWVRLHGNYPWHRDALLRALGAARPDDVPAAVAARLALEVEAAVVAADGCAAAVRPRGAWTTDAPLVARDAGPESRRAPAEPGALPASGVRVVDFTKVIAGPVGTRMLAALGAEVTRVADPARPELPLAALDGGLGKRWAELDLRTPAGREALERLLAGADVAVLGHRPGALDRFGLAPDALAERFPDLAVVSLSAWGGPGPSGALRGFDSLVQAATGIALEVRADPPGALPVQALDHATGYLIAAAALRALTERIRTGRAGRARLTLAATARALLDAPRPDPPTPERDVDPAPHLVTLGRLQVALPPGELDGAPLRWPGVGSRA